MLLLLLLFFSLCLLILPQVQMALEKQTSAAGNESVAIGMGAFLGNEDIKNTWPQQMLEHCLRPRIPPPEAGLRSFVRQLGLEQQRVEVLSRRPPILRLPRFLLDSDLEAISRKLRTSNEVESQGVEGFAYSPGHRGRQADGLWLLHHEKVIRPLYTRLQRVLALNPALGEDFLVLKYAPFGHYAPHFDHLDPMPPSYDDGWFTYFGNRLATALLLVQTASAGGFTVFPELSLTIQPERGDLLLWFNADSNDRKEGLALHAACPILQGQKVAVSLWIRGNFQDGLKCSRADSSYESEDLIRRRLGPLPLPRERPRVPGWVFK